MTHAVSSPRNANVFRGLAYAVPMGMLGFSVPYLGTALVFTARYFLREFDERAWLDFQDDIRLMAAGLIPPALACAFLFALAAILNYSPGTRLGMMRALSYVGLAILFGGMAAEVIYIVFALEQPTISIRRDDPWSDWRGPMFALISLSVPVVYTVEHTYRLIRRDESQ